MSDAPEDRLARGTETLHKLWPPGSAGVPQFQYPTEIAQEFGTLAVSTVLGDIWSRPGLELKQRTIVAISALTALNRPDQLKAYIIAALNLGMTRNEVCEIILQMAIYAGFPAAIQAFVHAREVFEQLDRAASAG